MVVRFKEELLFIFEAKEAINRGKERDEKNSDTKHSGFPCLPSKDENEEGPGKETANRPVQEKPK